MSSKLSVNIDHTLLFQDGEKIRPEDDDKPEPDCDIIKVDRQIDRQLDKQLKKIDR